MSDLPSDEELRGLVRAAIAKRQAPPEPARIPVPGFSRHASHLLLHLSSGGDGDGACLIEPAVRCNHCGYCQSYGH